MKNIKKNKKKIYFDYLHSKIGLGYFLTKTYDGKIIYKLITNYIIYHYDNDINDDNIIKFLINAIPRKYFNESRELKKYEEIYS